MYFWTKQISLSWLPWLHLSVPPDIPMSCMKIVYCIFKRRYFIGSVALIFFLEAVYSHKRMRPPNLGLKFSICVDVVTFTQISGSKQWGKSNLTVDDRNLWTTETYLCPTLLHKAHSNLICYLEKITGCTAVCRNLKWDHLNILKHCFKNHLTCIFLFFCFVCFFAF